ncbi:hypothetical protein CLCR_03177 [Cladophialophora carrionii]|uniref:Uncharacterized protein n=1 Tax=Cladophialophora carrionii TaxID=86049 RepID=A0A1C1D2I0_9EURO|nr:hypothetical protein CLCR_03177 [Cladophialophora carrionii]
MEMQLRLYVLADRLQAVMLSGIILCEPPIGLPAGSSMKDATRETSPETQDPEILYRTHCIPRWGERRRVHRLAFRSVTDSRGLSARSMLAKIFADMMNKYDTVVMEPTEENGSTVMSFFDPRNVLAGSRDAKRARKP